MAICLQFIKHIFKLLQTSGVHYYNIIIYFSLFVYAIVTTMATRISKKETLIKVPTILNGVFSQRKRCIIAKARAMFRRWGPDVHRRHMSIIRHVVITDDLLCSFQEWHSGKWICSALPAVGSNDFLVSKPGFLTIRDFGSGML